MNKQKLEYIVVKGESIYSSEIEEIYHQNDKEHGGIFSNRCMIKDVNKLAKDYRKNIFMVCAVREGSVVGFAQLIDCYVPNSLYVAVLAVDKACRGQGIGTGLIDFAIHHCAGFESISLEVFSSNKDAMKLYEKLGFEKILTYKIEDSEFRGEEQNFFKIPSEKVLNNMPIEYSEMKSEDFSRRAIEPRIQQERQKFEKASIEYDNLDEPFSSR